MLISMPCKFSNDKIFIHEAIQRIKDFMPSNTKIVVHDSQSEDMSYIDEIEYFKNLYVIYNNIGYETSAIWETYANFPHEDYYFFLHDSIHLKADISSFAEKELTTLAWFPGDFWFEQDEQDLAHEELNKADYIFDMNFKGIFGSVFGCQLSILEKIRNKGADKIIPNNKLGSRTMERLWGMILCQEGYEELIINNSIYGQCTDIYSLENEYFKKWIVRRQ